MIRGIIVVFGLTLASFVCAAQSTAFVNGYWFDGGSFAKTTVYSAGGNLTFRKPESIDATVDLAGGFVTPPFGEAHNHNVEPLNRIEPLVARYLRHGIFYVKNPNCLPPTREQLTGRVNTPSTIDVVFANGGFTGSGGHPIEFQKRNIERGIWTDADGEGAFFYSVDNEAGFERKWPGHMATHPDFIKTYLLYSEEYQTRKNDAAFFGWKGLDPSLLNKIVAKAHAAGLRVSAHIETAADFHNALAAGADEINHMPGFRMYADVRQHPDSAFEVSQADADLAARQRTYVVTTLMNALEGDQRKRQDALNVRNLRLLHASGVRLAVGSDSYRADSLSEMLYLESLHALDNLSLLKMWCETTAQTIFPGRNIGALREGYEANFIVLDGDPLMEFSSVTKVRLQVKNGKLLSVPPETAK
jgi:imidazolonepropionase-like amidohydrolase